MTDRLQIETTDGIVTIRLNRPEKLNAIDPDMMAALDTAVSAIERDASARAVIVTGTGKAFSVGADIGAFSALGPADTWRDWVRGGHALIDRIASLRVPVIGALNGYTLGGGLELALAFDFCIAADTAVFASPEVRIGTVCGWGATQRLPKLIGRARASQMIYTGDTIPAGQARDWGLVTELHPADALMDRAQELAQQIAANAPLSVQVSKQLVDGAGGVLLGATLESLAGGFCKATEDGQEGLVAFLEKRPPNYKGQ
ncbi:enoyl-CoA hydratase/isomerase family protein [Oceanomicrobium pacificus]|uniref:Enoyl-CoA hydratase/isomerase family protein n=1 Tax=Oceanomicrobium pacificus TaxID=2692916 RepID=A0A6B0TP27_9RHOB|nr:enoyl-CoA hydratase/isomerase family protein [Oceanomicrobium pacificus]MXU64349.1 enoyl-CoA hydratase/isomerase family protein [Oceanomicrobium pacificus]